MPVNPSYIEIGAFEAKTRLSELLRKVEQGGRFTITHRGRPVAQLTPPAQAGRNVNESVLERLMNPPVKGIPGETVLGWIRKGRK